MHGLASNAQHANASIAWLLAIKEHGLMITSLIRLQAQSNYCRATGITHCRCKASCWSAMELQIAVKHTCDHCDSVAH